MLSQSIDAESMRWRKKSRSRSKGPYNEPVNSSLAYVSVMTAPRSRSRSNKKFRSSSVKSKKSSKTKQFKKLYGKNQAD